MPSSCQIFWIVLSSVALKDDGLPSESKGADSIDGRDVLFHEVPVVVCPLKSR